MSDSSESVWDLDEEDLEKLRGETIILSMSGGEDSTATALLLEHNGIPFTSVFMDTGWEHPVTYEYLDTVLTERFGEVVRLSSSFEDPDEDGQFVSLVRKKQMFPSRLIRFCTQELKVKPFQKYLESLDSDPIVVLGIRREESSARAKFDRWKFNETYDAMVFAPLVDHTFDDIIKMHQEKEILPNPLYLQGAQRVGCFPCIFARKNEVKTAAKLYPERFNVIERLEDELSEAKGKRLSFFHGRGTGDAGIRDVLQWASTEWGGKQYPMFDFTAQDGCTRWGMCEAPESRTQYVTVEERKRKEGEESK